MLSNKLRGKWRHHLSCSRLGGDPVSCQQQYGRSGRKMAQAKVRYSQGQGQVSKPGLWSCQQHRTLGKVSVEPTARDAKRGQGFFVGGMGKEANPQTRRPLFFLRLAHCYSSFGLQLRHFLKAAPRPGAVPLFYILLSPRNSSTQHS